MKSFNQKRSKTDCLNRWPPCWIFRKLSCIVGWWIWVTRVIFTWTNGRDDLVQEWLDRACATIEWRDKFAQVQVTHLEASYSDHSPILVTTHIRPHTTLRKKIPHRFEEIWATHPDCENIIQVAWDSIVPNGSPMVRLFEKIKRCCFALVDWSRLTFGLSKQQLQEKQKILEELCL